MKVLILGAPKSGTSILYQRVLLGFEQSGLRPQSVFEPCSRRRGSGGWELIKDGAAPIAEAEHTLVKALWVEKPSPAGIPGYKALGDFLDYDQKIFLFRDPRDRLISQFFYRWFHLAHRFPARFRHCIEQVRIKELAPDSLSFHELCVRTGLFQPVWTWSLLTRSFATAVSGPWEHWWQSRLRRQLAALSRFLVAAREAGWCVLHYEDLIDGKIEEVERRLGFALPQVTVRNSILRRVARSEGYGSWRQWFTADDEVHFRPVFATALNSMGYDANDWRLNPGAPLSPDEGSRYLERLAGAQRRTGERQ
jgi:hypothetical protein